MNIRPRNTQHFLRRHWLIISIIPVLICLTGGGLWWYVSSQDAVHAAQVRRHAETLADLNSQIEEIKARKAEEERIRREAEAKATADEVLQTPEAAAGSIDAAKCNISGTRNDPTSADVLVNKKHCIQPLTYAPSNLVNAYGALLAAPAAAQFKLLYEAAAAAGQGISVTSSYRSYSNQISTYNYWVQQSGAAAADTYSARPGYSEHQTGFAVDIASADGACSLDCFKNVSQYAWMRDNAANFGFIQRYHAGFETITGYMAEEWHYRYVGVDVAKDMQQKNVKTLEQYWNMPGGTY